MPDPAPPLKQPSVLPWSDDAASTRVPGDGVDPALDAGPRATWRSRLRAFDRIYDAPEPLAGTFRARQFEAVLRLFPLALAGNLFNSLVMTVAFWDVANRSWLIAWFTAFALSALTGAPAWWRYFTGRLRPRCSPRVLQRVFWHAVWSASLWAMMEVLLLPHAVGTSQIFAWVTTAGMICAGGFALTTIPTAGIAYVGILSIGMAVAMMRTTLPMWGLLLGMLMLYSLVSMVSVRLSGRSFGQRLMNEADAQHQRQVVGLLLRDFEEHSSDVLWEIDGHGRLCHLNARIATALGCTMAQLREKPLLALLADMQADLPFSDRWTLEALGQVFKRGLPFRDQLIAVALQGRTRWWSMTAKPLVDVQGRCTGWRGVATDVTHTQEANRQLTFLAHYDPLTGLTNRHQFRNAAAEVLRPLPDGEVRVCAALCLDLDHFKSTNDTLGHAAGDAMLAEVGRRLKHYTRRHDLVSRLGGDEFAMLLVDVGSEEEVALLTRRLLDNLQQPLIHQGAALSIRTSVGVAMAPRDGTELDTLLSHADLALYEAKRGGRGDFRFFVPSMAALTRRRLLIEQALRDALPHKEFSLVFQPQVRLDEWRVVAFEALLRWTHPELGTVPPNEFIAVAEDCGLMPDIGAWVLHEACRHAAAWSEPHIVSVNVSPVQAMSGALVNTVQQALAASGLAPQRLELEITESIFITETITTLQVLDALQRTGVRVALDDFGTGYSSLAYLRRFPFNTLKIDRAFVLEVMTRRDARAIVQTIIGLAQTLRMDTVAEGVEEAEQVATLLQYGCSAIQGYFIAKPMPPAQVGAFLAEFAQRARPEGLGYWLTTTTTADTLGGG